MASEPLRISETLKFGDDFELDLRSYELRRAGRPVKLERLPTDLLVLLIERRGQLVSRQQIIERVWGKDVFLDTDNSINAAIRKIRQVLKDDPEQPRYVQTVTGRGYRFIAQIMEPSPAPVAAPPVPEVAPAPERLLGRKISHYRILELLGGGGMGVVYKAEDLKLGRRVAIKFLPGELASDPKAFDRFEREARAASALDHRNICSIYELGEYEGQPFIVMQLLEGETLREWIERNGGQGGAQHQRLFVDLAIQIADGLDAAHQKGIIHRDIKPANIFITNRAEAKILDFGVAKFLEAPEAAPGPASAEHDAAPTNLTLTRTGSVGTPSYLSPEQIRGEKLDTRTDLFSFGLVLYEMATGRRAFAGDTVTVIRNAVLNHPAVPARQLNPNLPPELDAVITQALEKGRECRFQSATQMRAALDHFRQEMAPSAKRPGRRRFWLALPGAAVLVIAAVLSFTNVGHRLWHTGSNESPSAEIKPRRSVAVLGFKNLSGKAEEDWISTALAEMFSTELAAGQQLRTIPGENIARMKLDLSLPSADSYSRETLGKINNLLSADMVVLGSYLAVGKESGGKVRIDLQLQDTRAGETIAVISQDGTEADLADLVSRAGSGLRQTLGVSVASSTDAGAVRAAIPTDPQAARLYAEGLAKLRTFDALAARDLLEKAIAADPSHALSHSALAEAWSALGYDAKAQEEAKKAFDLSAGLSREDRLSVEGRYRVLTHDFASAIDIYRTLRNFFPDSLDYGLRLASAQLDAGHGNDAAETIARMRALPPPESNDPRIDLMETHVGEAISEFKQAQQLATAAAAKGQAQGSRLIVAQAREREGWAWDELGDSDKALSALSEARDLFASGGNPRDSAVALLDSGDVWFDRGDYVRARQAYDDALNRFRDIGARQKTAYTLSRIGSLLYQQGKLEEAKRFQEEALQVDREIGNGTERDKCNLANVLDAMGDLRGAVDLWQQAAQGFHQEGDRSNEAVSLSNLGGGYLRRADIAVAKKHIEAAIAIQQAVSNRRGLGFSLYVASEIQRAQDQLSDARATTERNLAMRKELKDDTGIAATQMQLAEIALEQDRYSEAEALAQTAAAAFDHQKVTDQGAEAYGDLARALLAQGKTREAETAANRAVVLSHQGGDLASRFEATLSAATVSGNTGNISAALKYFETVRAETSRRGYGLYELKARLGLGELELRSGQTAAGRARLQALQKDARDKGFVQIARRAEAALGSARTKS